jgi:acetyl esterase
MRRLASDSGVNILSVEYRLAPEHPFPAGLDDCYTATVWAADHAAEHSCSGTFLAVGGDSAGGNLAAAVAQISRDRGGPRIDHQLLVYPVVTPNFDTSSYRRFATGYFLTRATMEAFWRLYVGELDRPAPMYADLLANSLAQLPEATVITCGLDVLSDEGGEYAARLAAAGVPVTSIHIHGLIHGIWNMDASGPRAARFGLDVAAALRRAAHDPRTPHDRSS